MTKARILVVEDEKLLRWSIRDRLVQEDYRVEEAASGAEALPVLQRGNLDLALFDYQLPDTDGLRLLEGQSASLPPG